MAVLVAMGYVLFMCEDCYVCTGRFFDEEEQHMLFPLVSDCRVHSVCLILDIVVQHGHTISELSA
jgi:hypothetical protein